jgi:hypothetical protein
MDGVADVELQRDAVESVPCAQHLGIHAAVVGRVFLRTEMLVIAAAIREARVQKAATPSARTADWRDVLRDLRSQPTVPAWLMPTGQTQPG